MANVDLEELDRYLRIFQENPDSRVFAPLSDLYRRLGRLREAESVAREGVQRHPYYAGGRVALAHVLLEKGEYDASAKEADNVVTYYPENLLARKILIRALGAMGESQRARREYEALKQMAPLVASDPELERAMQGPLPMSALPHSPGPTATARPLPPVPGGSLREVIQAEQDPMTRQVGDRTEWMPEPLKIESLSSIRASEIPSYEAPRDPSQTRGETLGRLLRKKAIFEIWSAKLGEVRPIR